MPIPAAENAPDPRLVVKDETVDVFAPDGRLLQSLPIEGNTPDDGNREYFAIVEDMNFDGFPDVRILFSQGNANIYYDGWLWRPKEEAFVRYEAMRDISDPQFDQDSKTVLCYERGSAVANMSGRMAWQKGELVWLEQTVQDAVDDGEHIVVQRYLRGIDGELRLVHESSCLPENIAECRNDESMDDAYYRPELPGLNLVLDLPADPFDVAVLPNGEWWLSQGLEDRALSIESRRLPALEYGEGAVEHLVRLGWPQARDVAITPFSSLAEKARYPALKAEFLTGHNEDTRRYVAALVFADEWSFWFVLDASADAELAEPMEQTLLRIVHADPADGDFLPSSGVPVYIAGGDSPLRISVMDALVRIKEVVQPEDGVSMGMGRVAYRYDGSGKAGDNICLLFSFGGDSREKFTAERHFAVDEAGNVYEMNSGGGGTYWKWESEGAAWWGEYQRDDGAVLHIFNYRHGPFGLYFMFAFDVGGETAFEGTAAVRGREAQCESIVFSLSGDDDTVTVRSDPERPGDAERARLEGVYGME